ncbi:MAG: hydroxymethylbilane synthase [Planctomycetota bacterium]|jgi:hydroxymethylbilane synthase
MMLEDQKPIRLGTRGSDLALWQAETVHDLLSREAPMRDVEIIKVKTLGDKRTDVKIAELGRTAVFTAELDDALLRSSIDLAVHSLKDLETAELPGMTLAAVLPRGPVEDCFISSVPFSELPEGAKVGTGSVRRVAQIKRLRPDIEIVPIRGNVPTRVGLVDAGVVDGIVMARAGMVRLGLAHRIASIFDVNDFLPAVGQGAVAITIRTEDESMARIMTGLNHEATWKIVQAERACLRKLGGGCNVPLGVSFTYDGDVMKLSAAVYSEDGTEVVEAQIDLPSDHDGIEAGLKVAGALIDGGCRRLIEKPSAGDTK